MVQSRIKPFFAFGAAVIFAALSGCGYSTTRPFPTDIQTVHVEMFQSREFRRELEFQLTEALVKRIEMDTPYRVTRLEDADAVLSGEVISVQNRVFGDDFDTDLPREIGSTITVRYRLQDIRTGRILVEKPRFVYQTSYIPPVGETFRVAMVRGMGGLAEQIVESMESGW
ncbi:MAG: LptE family protein [Phycisphaerae bacterium]|nr:LptE family protein [Phycisphaerae bacterium]